MVTVSARNPESVALEAEYARLLLADLLAVNEACRLAASCLASAAVNVLHVVAGTDDYGTNADAVSDAITVTMGELAKIQAACGRAVDLLDGRVKVVERELDGDDADESPSEDSDA